MEEEAIIQQFLGEQPRAEQLSGWIEVLQSRLARLESEARQLAPGSTPPAALAGGLADLRRQISALQEEAAISQFVEDSVRVTLAMGAVTDPTGEDG